MSDSDHEAFGAMVYRGLVDARASPSLTDDAAARLAIDEATVRADERRRCASIIENADGGPDMPLCSFTLAFISDLLRK